MSNSLHLIGASRKFRDGIPAEGELRGHPHWLPKNAVQPPLNPFGRI